MVNECPLKHVDFSLECKLDIKMLSMCKSERGKIAAEMHLKNTSCANLERLIVSNFANRLRCRKLVYVAVMRHLTLKKLNIFA